MSNADPSKGNLTSDAIREIVGSVNTSSLNRMASEIMEEIKNRLIEDQDLEMLMDIAMKKGFDGSGSPVDPFEVAPGILALASTVKDTSSTRHICTHYTVRPSANIPDEYWSFVESPTMLMNETNKVDKVRTSVALHAMPSGSAVIRHTMTHDGERHNRKGTRGWKIDLIFDEKTDQPRVKIISDATIKSTSLPNPND